MTGSARSLQHDATEPSSPAPGLTIVSRSPQTRASNAARAALVAGACATDGRQRVADRLQRRDLHGEPCARRHANDIRPERGAGGTHLHLLAAAKVAAAMSCSERAPVTARRSVPARSDPVLTVRRRVNPAKPYVWVQPAGLADGSDGEGVLYWHRNLASGLASGLNRTTY